MSEERLARLEDMMGQLIGMVGKVLSEQHDTKQVITRMDERLGRVEDRLERVEDRLEKVEGRLEKVEDRLEKVEGGLEKVEDRLEKVESHQLRFNDTMAYLVDKSTQHDHDIHVLKRHILK